jgi:dipeptidyl aminopeptidase/acylaminoacyl peptidase
MKRSRAFPGAAAALSLALATLAPQSGAAADLLPRGDVFGNPERANAELSPDGQRLAFLAPREGVLNVWVAPVADPAAARPVTSEAERPVFNYFWSPDSSRIFYLQDQGGNENYLLFSVDLEGKETRAHTPFDSTRAIVYAVSPEVRDAILIGLNNRNPQYHDVYRLDLETGRLSFVFQNDEWAGLDFDRQLRPRLGTKQTPQGGFELFRFDEDGHATAFAAIGPEDSLTTQPAGFATDGTLYMLDSRGRDKAALTAVDLETGKSKVIGESDKADVNGTIRDPRTGEVQAFSANYLKPRMTPVGDALKGDIEFLDGSAGGAWSVTSQSDDNRLWTVGVDRVTEPYTYYLYDRGKKSLTKLFTTRPALEGKTLAAMHPREIASRDGLTLVSYLTLPPGTDPDGDGQPSEPLPTVLFVHGGPWARDEFGYNAVHQWLANRGYAVLSVNYRGSTGFGKSFLNAANGEFAGKMHDDLIDAVNWALQGGIAKDGEVAIMGGSYGGYATLVGVTFTPDAFACGVDIVGPSSLVTLIESFPEYWKPFLEATWYKRVGDPRTEAGRKDLLARSPITRVDRIKVPLLIAQGANDPRVTQRESDQLVAAMKERGIPVTYVLYPDEGHGFAEAANRISFFAVSEAFLSKCLGGRFEPIGDDFEGASLQVPEGADYVPGLADALK